MNSSKGCTKILERDLDKLYGIIGLKYFLSGRILGGDFLKEPTNVGQNVNMVFWEIDPRNLKIINDK